MPPDDPRAPSGVSPTAPRPDRSSRSDPMVLMVIAVVLLAARIGLSLYTSKHPLVEPDRVHWQPIVFADSLARAERKPILYEFSADWCGPCQQMERDVFADEKHARMLSQFVVPVRIIDRQRELGHNSPLVDSLQRVHDVRAFPTLVLVGADGKTIDRMEGFPGTERFMTWVASAGARQGVPKGGATLMFP